jgi:sulfur-oxidizing protein SoxY
MFCETVVDDKHQRTHRFPIDRRAVLLAGGAMTAAAAGLLGTRSQSLAAVEPVSPYSPQFEEALAKVVGSGFPLKERVTLELPELAENGNIVPYKIEVESPMTEDDYIARVHLLSTANPQPSVATFHFTPQSGKAAVAGRMRLAKTQDVVVIALTNTNTLLETRRSIEVTIGGCGTE